MLPAGDSAAVAAGVMMRRTLGPSALPARDGELTVPLSTPGPPAPPPPLRRIPAAAAAAPAAPYPAAAAPLLLMRRMVAVSAVLGLDAVTACRPTGGAGPVADAGGLRAR